VTQHIGGGITSGALVDIAISGGAVCHVTSPSPRANLVASGDHGSRRRLLPPVLERRHKVVRRPCCGRHSPTRGCLKPSICRSRLSPVAVPPLPPSPASVDAAEAAAAFGLEKSEPQRDLAWIEAVDESLDASRLFLEPLDELDVRARCNRGNRVGLFKLRISFGQRRCVLVDFVPCRGSLRACRPSL
jgi:hypothetical protein